MNRGRNGGMHVSYHGRNAVDFAPVNVGPILLVAIAHRHAFIRAYTHIDIHTYIRSYMYSWLHRSMKTHLHVHIYVFIHINVGLYRMGM